ncbi:Protection of telomeres protein [Parasponia andersonii]|uniref:Protection of telomeres protein 1 n=1 Tax=Parasponia andersonii TaxID=3476 RepID=A0A2P5CUV9_PARAD|nr:Protection of telomeres protein [Parasponia andersonii]
MRLRDHTHSYSHSHSHSHSHSSSTGNLMTVRDAVAAYTRKKKTIKATFLACLIEFSLPKKTQGTDYVVTVRIVDELLAELSVNMFADKEDHLPRLHSYKDLILLNDVMIKHYDSQVCGVFYSNSSSFALFDVKTNTNIPYQTSPRFHLHDLDIPSIQRIRTFTTQYQVSADINHYRISLKDLGTKMFFDLVCQVLYVQRVWDGGCMLYIWDGKDAPPLHVQRSLEDEEDDPLPLEVEPTTLNMHILRKFPCVGTVLRVMAHVDMSVHFPQMGQWVKIRNMKCDQLESGLWLGHLLPTTKLRFLPDNEPTVIECKRALDERGLGTEGRLPLWSNPLSGLTVVDSTGFSFATLLDLITLTEAETIVRCVVRIVAICPSDVEGLRLENGDYRIMLTLEDPTARIHALLDSHHGDVFFENFTSASDASKRMTMNVLLGSEGKDRNPPWIECCIRSNANRIYYICRTRLVA